MSTKKSPPKARAVTLQCAGAGGRHDGTSEEDGRQAMITSSNSTTTRRSAGSTGPRQLCHMQPLVVELTDAWGIKVTNVEIKDVDIDLTMVRASPARPRPIASDGPR